MRARLCEGILLGQCRTEGLPLLSASRHIVVLMTVSLVSSIVLATGRPHTILPEEMKDVCGEEHSCEWSHQPSLFSQLPLLFRRSVPSPGQSLSELHLASWHTSVPVTALLVNSYL